MNELSDVLQRQAAKVQPMPDLADVNGRADRRRRRARAGRLVVTACAVVAVVVGLITVTRLRTANDGVAPGSMSDVTIATVLASDAPRVALTEQFIEALNRGDRATILTLLSDDPTVSDCDYAAAKAVSFRGRGQVTSWIDARIADHDRLVAERIENGNTDAATAAIGVVFARRTSDTLRGLGFPDGVKPQGGAKVEFIGIGDSLRIGTFANGPVGGPPTLCVPAASATAVTTPSKFDAFASLPIGRAGCSPASPMIGNEFRGTSDNGQLSGLIFNTRSSMHAGDNVKLVVRMTGSGPLKVTAIAPNGASSSLPTTAHTGSTFNRPGDEWDTEITYTERGCWQMHLTRTNTAADVWFQISS